LRAAPGAARLRSAVLTAQHPSCCGTQLAVSSAAELAARKVEAELKVSRAQLAECQARAPRPPSRSGSLRARSHRVASAAARRAVHISGQQWSGLLVRLLCTECLKSSGSERLATRRVQEAVQAKEVELRSQGQELMRAVADASELRARHARAASSHFAAVGPCCTQHIAATGLSPRRRRGSAAARPPGIRR